MTTIAMSEAETPAEASRHFGTLMVGRFEGFPSLVRAVGQPAMPDVSRRVHEMLGYYIGRYNGTVVQAKAGTVVALFTAGDAEDNHAVRALGAAIAIRRACAGAYMTVRSSVHSGCVTAPETLGVARSLGEEAGDNRIRASDRTVSLASEQFEFENVGRRTVDGAGEVDVFELLAVARSHAGKLDAYLRRDAGSADGSMARTFPVLLDIIRSVRR